MFPRTRRKIEALAFLLEDLRKETGKHARQTEVTRVDAKIAALEAKVNSMQKQIDRLNGVHGA